MRIVSLVPSLTELLLYLELEVVGRTKFCIHPQKQSSLIPKVGGTKTVDVNKVIALKPDLVIANKEENTKEQILDLKNAGLNVYMSDIADFEDSLAAIIDIGRLTDTAYACQALTKKLLEKVSSLPQSGQTACYLIWRKPYMTIGTDTYIYDMLKRSGYTSVFDNKTRYPEVTLDQIKSKNPDVIMLSSEPFPFKNKHIEEIKSVLPNTKTILVDGEYFSWYGCRLLKLEGYTSID